MDDTISRHPIDDFDAAWQIVGQHYQPAIQVTSALIKLSGGGEWPVEVERLAAASGRPVDETLALARQFLKVNVRDGLVHLDLSAAGTSARYRLQIGARTIDADGCAPDIVWTALLAGTPIHAEATCPATGTPIRADLTPDGVERVEPPSTVIAVISPLVPQLQQLRAGNKLKRTSAPSSHSSLQQRRRQTGSPNTPPGVSFRFGSFSCGGDASLPP